MDKLIQKQKQNGSPLFLAQTVIIFLLFPNVHLPSLTSFLQHSTGVLQVPDRLLTVPDPAFCFPDLILQELDCHGPRQGLNRRTQPITVETSTVGSSRVNIRVFGVIFAVKHPYDSWDSKRKRGIFYFILIFNLSSPFANLWVFLAKTKP